MSGLLSDIYPSSDRHLLPGRLNDVPQKELFKLLDDISVNKNSTILVDGIAGRLP